MFTRSPVEEDETHYGAQRCCFNFSDWQGSAQMIRPTAFPWAAPAQETVMTASDRGWSHRPSLELGGSRQPSPGYE